MSLLLLVLEPVAQEVRITEEEELDIEADDSVYVCVCRAVGYVDQVIMIFDVGGGSTRHVDLSLTRKQLKLVMDYFPEGIFKLVAINVDFFSRLLYKAIKPFVESNTLEKVSAQEREGGRRRLV